jgi:tetratricopeptide (TPR) repeat protein
MMTSISRKIIASVFLLAAAGALFAADPRPLYQDGARAQAEGNYHLAVEKFTAALAGNPAYLEAMTGMAECFFLLEEYDEALRWVTEALRFDRGNPGLLVLQGRVLIGMGRPAEARKVFSIVLSLRPNDLEARFGQAEAEVAEGRTSTALSQYSQTLRLAPESRKALLSLAMLSASLGDAAAASRYYELALRSHAADPAVQLAAAEWEAGQGRFESAERRARIALSLAPGLPRARITLGGILLDSGKPLDAAVELREAVAMERDNPLAWQALGMAYRKAGDAAKAIASFASGLSAVPSDEILRISQENTALDSLPLDDPIRKKAAAAHLEQGGLLEQRNSLETALAEYRRALLLDPTGRDARVAYARVFRSLGFPDKYLSELKVVASLGAADTFVVDEIEGLRSELAEGISRVWGFDQHTLDRSRYNVPVFTLPSTNRLLHAAAHDELARAFAAMLSRFPSISVPDLPRVVTGFEEAFRAARESGSDWFIVLEMEESERSFSVVADLHLSRTGARLASIGVYRTGNDRVRDSFLRIGADIAARLPMRGALIARRLDQGLIDLGSIHGLKKGDRLTIVRKGALRLSNQGPGLAWEPANVVGEFTVGVVDEAVSEGTIARKGYFDLVNVGDTVAVEPVAAAESSKPAPAAPATVVRSLLARLFRIGAR